MSYPLTAAQSLRGDVTVPGDKSISHRAVMFGALADADTHITGFLMGEDCLSTISCFKKMGVSIDVSEKEVVVHGVGLHGLKAPDELLYTGNSGTTTRLLCGILAGQPFSSTVNGDTSIQKRPMGRIMKPLQAMGADIASDRGNDCAPLTIKGHPLKAIHYDSPVASARNGRGYFRQRRQSLSADHSSCPTARHSLHHAGRIGTAEVCHSARGLVRGQPDNGC